MVELWWQSGVVWVVAVAAVAALDVLGEGLRSPGPINTRFVKKDIEPSGDIYTSALVSSVVQCGALCQLFPCEAFVMRHNNSDDDQHKHTCTILTNLKAPSSTTTPESGSDTTNQEGSVYVRFTDNEPAVTTVFPQDELRQELRLEENLGDEKEECSKNRAISGLALTTGDVSMSTVDFFECRKFIEPEKMSIEECNEQTVETTPSAACTNNRVLVGFRAYDVNDAPQKRWNNPHTLRGVCHELENYQVNYNGCENVTVSSGPWNGEEHTTSQEWDTIFYCPPYTLAIGMTREFHGSAFKIMSLICCLIRPTVDD